MTAIDLSPPQKAALLDLTLLAMYADGHLASVEDERVHRLLGQMGFSSESERNREYDASVARLRRLTQTPEASLAHATRLAQSFPHHEQRRLVQATLDDLVTSDTHVSLQESGLLSAIREVLGS